MTPAATKQRTASADSGRPYDHRFLATGQRDDETIRPNGMHGSVKEVHLGRANEAGDKLVGRCVVQLVRYPNLLDIA